MIYIRTNSISDDATAFKSKSRIGLKILPPYNTKPKINLVYQRTTTYKITKVSYFTFGQLTPVSINEKCCKCSDFSTVEIINIVFWIVLKWLLIIQISSWKCAVYPKKNLLFHHFILLCFGFSCFHICLSRSPDVTVGVNDNLKSLTTSI